MESWEVTDMYNVGTDISLFNSRLNITAEAYLSYTEDLLLSLQTPKQTGFTSHLLNVGKTSNKGVELSIESRNIITRDFTWSTSFSVSHNKQMVENIGTEDFVSVFNSSGNNPYMMYGYVKGYPLNSLWGFKYGGTWKSKEEWERNKVTKAYVHPGTGTPTPGLPRFYDIDHNGSLNEKDLVYQGNADPWLYGGLQNNFRYRNITLGVFFHYSLGGKIYNITEQWMSGSTFANQYRYMLKAWHPVRNPESDIPRAGNNILLQSDRNIYDASYLRLKNVSIAYNVPLNPKTKEIIRDIQLSVSGENLYLWKKYNGFDPDVSTSSGGSTLRRVDNGAYPKSRTVIFSVQIRY